MLSKILPQWTINGNRGKKTSCLEHISAMLEVFASSNDLIQWILGRTSSQNIKTYTWLTLTISLLKFYPYDMHGIVGQLYELSLYLV
jgi:hypothetical protein